jgi:alkylated DNA repair dioxygenase AlkB
MPTETTFLPGNAAIKYKQNAIRDDSISSQVMLEDMHHYKYRGKGMKRAPKNEFYYPGNEEKTYKWGQERKMYPGGEEYVGKRMPKWMRRLARKIDRKYGEQVNHAIIIKYDHGVRTHAPPHKDKIPEGTSFFVYSFGTPREFDVRETIQVECRDAKKRGTDGDFILKYNKDGSVKTKDASGGVVFQKHLQHNSLLVVDPNTNKEYYHSIPKDRNWNGNRWSLIFRTIR